VKAGPGDEPATTANPSRGHLLASHADREQVIDTLKTAFAEGRLAKDEFDLRVDRTFAARTHAELAAVTARLPAEPPTAQPPAPSRAENEPPVLRPGPVITVATAVCAGVWMFGLLVPWPRDSEGDLPHGVAVLVYLTTLIYLFVLAMTLWLGGAVVVESWLKRRSRGRRARRGDGQPRVTALRFPASRWWGGAVMSGPGEQTASAENRDRGHLRASHADREQVIDTLKTAYVQGRLTEDELDARVDQVYASPTYAELAEVTADIPAELSQARSPRDPWRATKVAWGVVYALILPGLITLVALPGGPAPTTGREVVTYTAVVYAIFWILGVCVMVASRRGKRSGGQPPPRSAPGAGG
jgi:hypothetical protein